MISEKENKIEYSPMIVPEKKGINDSPETILNRWAEFKKLPELAKDVLIAPDTPENLEKVCRGFHVKEEEHADLVKMVRDIFFGLVSKKRMKEELSRRVPSLSQANVGSVVQIIENRFLKPAFEGQGGMPKQQTVKMPIRDALAKYPMIAAQVVSRAPIMVGSDKEPKRGTIENWLGSYTREVGPNNKDGVKRAGYLFRHENAKKLTPGERQKVALILKSFDENGPVSVDPTRQEIVFSLKTMMTMFQGRSLPVGEEDAPALTKESRASGGKKPDIAVPGPDTGNGGKKHPEKNAIDEKTEIEKKAQNLSRIRFSSGQTLSAENKNSRRGFRIAPISFSDDDK